MNEPPAAIQLSNVCVTLGRTTVLDGVTADIPRGELTAIIGPNGAGKTTLLRVILGDVPYAGTAVLAPVNGSRPRIGYVPQRLDFDRGAPITVADLLCCNLQVRPLWLGYTRKASAVARRALERVGIGHLLTRPLGKLSGGELQRALLATALLESPDILLLDEPVAGVDVAGRESFCDILAELQAQTGSTMLMVSHDLSVVNEHADFVICLNQRVYCQGRTFDTLTADNLEAIYGTRSVLYHHHDAHEGAGHTHPAHEHGHDHRMPNRRRDGERPAEA